MKETERRISVVEEACRISEKGHQTGYTAGVGRMVKLTLEQLQTMDGKPVFVTPTGFWALVIAKKDKRVELICNDGETVWADKYIELVGDVYAYQPAHIDREAWEPCRYCGMAPFMDGVDLKPCASGYMGVEATVGKCRDDEAVGMVIYYKNAAAGYLDFAYCPFCGRPQTEEAWSKLENQLKAVKQIGVCEHEEKHSSPAL